MIKFLKILQFIYKIFFIILIVYRVNKILYLFPIICLNLIHIYFILQLQEIYELKAHGLVLYIFFYLYFLNNKTKIKNKVYKFMNFIFIKSSKIILALIIIFLSGGTEVGLDLFIFLNFLDTLPPGELPLYLKNYLKLSLSGMDSPINTEPSITGNSKKDFNFNSLSLKDKYEYLKLKFESKAIEPNIPFLDWFIQLLLNTDGSKNGTDLIIDKNLNAIQKIERESALNSHSFTRIKPILLHKTDNSPLQMANTIPYKIKNSYEE